LIAHGLHVRSDARIEGARIVDLAPTALHLMGHPVPQDMDGRVLADLLSPRFLNEHPVHVATPESRAKEEARSLSEEEEAELRLRLKGLGYLG
jgi:hypothetical protein